DPAMGKIEAVEYRAHLHRNRLSIDATRPQRIACSPSRAQKQGLLVIRETHGQRIAFARDVESDLALAEPHGASPLPHHRTPGPLSGNAALSLAKHVVDGGRDRGEHARHFSFGANRMKPAGKLLTEKCRRELSLLPARALHQRGEKRNIVAQPIDDK